MIEIDGSYKEGGGQIIRTASGLSALTGESFRIFNIRSGRKEQGLKEQHLQAIKAIKKLCGAEVKGLELGSTELEFIPGKISKKQLNVDIRTAGSTALVLQALLIPAIKHNLRIDINGGATFNLWAPSVPYMQNVLVYILNKLGFNVNIKIEKPGFYPTGGAKVFAQTKKVKETNDINIVEQGRLIGISGTSYASEHLKKGNVAERQASSAKKLFSRFMCPINISAEYVKSDCPGSGIFLKAEFENCVLGYDVVGEKGKYSEKVGEEAADGLIREIKSGATVDKFMTDQVLPYMALASHDSKVRVMDVTNHAHTNMWLIEKFLPVKFEVKENIIECKH